MFGKAKTLLFGALGVKLFQVERKLAYRALDPLLYPIEFGAAYLRQRGIGFAYVFGQYVHLLDGHIQHVAALVFERDVLLNSVGSLYFFCARYSAYAVLFVDGIVAYFGRGEHIPAFFAYTLCGYLGV